jgi:PAS domain-containing protein
MNFRKKTLIVLLLFGTIPLLLISIYSLKVTEKAIQNTMLYNLGKIADEKVVDITDFINDVNLQLVLMADTGIVRDALGTKRSTTKPMLLDIQRRFSLLAKIKSQFKTLLLIDKNSEIIDSFGEASTVFKINDKISPEFFQKAKQNSFISPLIKEKNSLYLIFFTPIQDRNNQFLGLLAFCIDLHPLFDVVNERQLLGDASEILVGIPEQNHFKIINASWHKDKIHEPIQIAFGSSLALPLQKALNKETSEEISIDYQGKEVLAAWRPVPLMDWGIASKIELSDALAPVKNLEKISIYFLVIIFFTVIVSATLFAKNLSQPIEVLVSDLKIFEQGNWDHKMTIKGSNEIAFLGTHINKAIEKIRSVTVSRDKLNVLYEEINDLYENAPCGYHSIDHDRKILRINNSELKLLEYSREELIGTDILDLMTKESQEIYLKAFTNYKLEIKNTTTEFLKFFRDYIEMQNIQVLELDFRL